MRWGSRRLHVARWSSALAASALAIAASTARGDVAREVESLASARAQQESGQTEQALRRLDSIARGRLGDHVALLQARILRAGGDLDASIRAARGGLALEPPSELRAHLHRQIALVHIDRRQLRDAQREQRQAWEASRNSELSARLASELGAVFESAGMTGEALSLYRSIWSRWPLAEASRAAFERDRSLTAEAGAEPPAVQELLDSAHRLRRARRCGQALGRYELALARPEEIDADERGDALHGRADCLFSRRRYPEAAAAYREIDSAEEDPRKVDAAIRVARSYARSGLDQEALAEFAEIRKRAGPAQRARCDYLSSIVVRTEQPKRHRRLLRRVERQKADRGLARQARWRLAWLDLRAGKMKRARRRLKPLTKGPHTDIEIQRARYWHAVAMDASRPREARSKLSELAESLPLSYYGLLAAERLDSKASPVRRFLAQRRGGEPHPRAERAGWLADAGFRELAILELESWLMGAERLPREQRLQAAALLQRIGEPYRALRLVVDGFGETLDLGLDPDWRDAWLMAWPRPFGEAVASASLEFEFDPSLIYAVMREESSFRTQVESPAGAIGLMQIIAPTGRGISKALGLQGFEPTQLKRPAVNVRFGAYYLSSLLARYAGSRALAVAAYNAGPQAVNRWLEQQGSLPRDVFVESVPYGETRRYLRRVFRSRLMYRLLYDGSDPGPSPP